jgi:SagB-type dehydrogenase family enzyme
VLTARRTIREFTGESVEPACLSQLCGLAFGAQDFIDAGSFGILPMKNYASAGARSELEVYANILAVSGLDTGLYHYNAVEHCLEHLRPALTREEVHYLTYEQPMCSQAAVVFFVTARVDRMGHKYRNPRALRAIYMDAGHLGQTFAMVATSLGLGPWQTAAFRDSEVERVLGVDGVAETALYCLGVGIPLPVPVTDVTLPASLAAASRTTLFEDFEVTAP